MTVIDLKKGEKGVVKDIDLQMIPTKLLELGCLPKNTIELLEKAPLGDPLYVKIDNNYLSIRCEIAQYILIEKTETDAKS